jgi:fatty acid CoA ligase FadD9
MAAVAPSTQSHDAQLRDAEPINAISDAIKAPDLRLPQIVQLVMEGYGDRPALGFRRQQLLTDPATGKHRLAFLPAFATMTYRELWARTRAIANVWHQDHILKAGDFVAILGFSSCDYVAIDLACIHAGAVSVPLQTNASLAQLQAIVAETMPKCLATSIENLETAVDIVMIGHVPTSLIVMDYRDDDDDQKERLEAAKACLNEAHSPTTLTTLEALCARGSAMGASPMAMAQPDEDPLATLFYTSGSTGSPKGAMYTEKLLKAAWLGVPPGPQIILNYMPLNHNFGRAWVFMSLARGGICNFVAKSDLSTLLDDIALVRPTNIALVPRICELIHQQFQAELERQSSADVDPATVRQSVLRHMRTHLLGGRLAAASIGSAPTAPELMTFMDELTGFKIVDSYGTTETGAITREGRVMRPPIIDYRLIDVPELGYFTTDKPHPRGEIAVKSHSVVAGYFKRPELTAAMFDTDGYYRTGDVMAEVGPDQLVYLDRRNNVLKLAQGEFVAIAHLEALFASASPLIRQIYIYGNSERSFLLAVIVPNYDGLPADVDVKPMLQAALQGVGSTENLHSYEIPRDLMIEDEPFSVENGLLAGVGKYLRPAFKARYGERLEALYAEIAAKQESDLRSLRSAGANAPVIETLSRAVQATLGLSQIDLSETLTFGELGGDSLSAVNFSMLIEEIFGVPVEVGTIINPASNLTGLARHIEALRCGEGSERASFVSVHGRDAIEVRAADLTLDKFIDAATLARAAALPPISDTAPTTVLLTGANGFLGRFLCLEWLQRMADVGGKVVCIARGKDDADARRRIAAVFDSGDPVLNAKFERLAADHLEVLAGDIGDAHLALTDADWVRLAATVDLIVHPAALVNHRLPYSQLFGPNVAGTAELIRLALTTKMKPFVNVSTVAAAIDAQGNWIPETADVRVAVPLRPCDGGYAGGYATSKWAGEVLLREAHDRFGLPVTIFRSDMILAHSKYSGQINVPDMFTRWLFSLIVSGIAPRSFYEGTGDRAHYDGLPVDFTAAAIADIGGAHRAGFGTYHVLNPHDDGISLDSFVDWVIEAGHPIERIADYQDWRTRFETALRALPDEKRQASSVPLITQLAQPSRVNAGSPVPSESFRTAVRARGLGNEGTIPHLSAAFIGKCVDDLRAADLIT